MIIPYTILDRSLGTSTAQTTLSGDQTGNAAAFQVPKWAQSIVAVRPYVTEITPTAGQSVVATFTATSNDVGIGNYEILGNALGSVLGATATFLSPGSGFYTYPWNLPVAGGNKITFLGQAQVANTAAPRMGATIWLSDQPASSFGSQAFAFTTSLNANSSNPVSTGTTAGVVNGTAFSISTGATIKALYGLISNGTIVASDTTSGLFQIASTDLSVNPVSWGIDPVTGFLGTTGQVQNIMAKAEGLQIPFKTPTTITPSLNLSVAPANAGKFFHTVLYTN